MTARSKRITVKGRWKLDAEIISELTCTPVDELNRLRERDEKGIPQVTHELYKRYWSGERSPEAEAKLYSDPLYLLESWICYFDWAKVAVDRLRRAHRREVLSLPEGSTVVDLGAGCGLSSIDLLGLHGVERVIYQNHPDAKTQIEFFKSAMLEEHTKLIEISTNGKIPVGNVYFASEFYEHFREPGEHLNKVLDNDPDVFIHASSFSAPWAPGHFHNYKYGDKIVPGNRGAKRLFHKILRQRGYKKKDHTVFWNGRPSVWVKTN